MEHKTRPVFIPITGTLQEAKDFLNLNWKIGVKCPCCNQTVKLYPTPLGSNMAMFLISLVKNYEIHKRPIHYKECKFGSRNYPHLSKWGLMETSKSPTTDKRTSGFWIPTQLGIDFAQNKIRVKAKAKIYNNKFYGFYGEDITIIDALKKKFNYEELMSSD